MPAFGAQSFLLLISQIAGSILLVFTMALVGFRRIYIDRETTRPIEFEFPLIGKVRSQAPALFLIAAGVLLVMYPLTKGGADQATIEGEIKAQGKPVTVLVFAVPQEYQMTVDGSGPFSMHVPLIPGTEYRVKFEIAQQIVSDQPGKLANNHIKLKPLEYTPSDASLIKPIKEGISDESLKALGIK
jgi:hypothetical protein